MTRSRIGGVSTWLGRLSIVFIIIGPFLAHFDVVNPFTGFKIFGLGFVLGLLSLLLGLVALLLGPGGSRGATVAGMLPGLLAVLVVYVANGAGLSVPRINDITTDTANPPQFVMALTLPENAGRDMAYPGEGFAQQQRDGYGEIAPVKLASPPDEAFKRVASTARSMDGWMITREDPAAHVIEGYETSSLFHFRDDFVIEVRPAGDGQSVVQMRSKSRYGQGDIGANAKRIRTFMGRLTS